MMNLRRLSYAVIAALGCCVALPGFALHSRGKRKLAQRLGDWKLPADKSYIWIHGASVGELRGILPLLPWLQARYPNAKVLMSSFSVTGIETLGEQVDEARVLPFDFAPLVSRAIHNVTFECFVFGETEIWPELLGQISKRNVPSLLVNGRIEESSFRLYRYLSWWFAKALRDLSICCVSSNEQADRFQALGVTNERLRVTGNAKYDRQPILNSTEDRATFARELGVDGQTVITLGSVHPGEESEWLKSYVEVFQKAKDVTLILAPRHLEKLAYFEAQLAESHIPYNKRSELSKGEQCTVPVLLIDSFGELEKVYAISQLAFVGGTLVPIGGHNPLEPAIYGVPVAIGPNCSQIPGERSALLEGEALYEISGADDIRDLLHRFVSEPAEFEAVGARGRQVSEKLRGATERTLEVFTEVLGAVEEEESYATVAR